MDEKYIKRRKGGGLAFNIKIPRAVAHHFPTASGKPGTHVTIGLGTRDMAVAIPKARALTVRWKAEFERLLLQPAGDPMDPARIYEETLARHGALESEDEEARLARTRALAEEAIAIQNELDRRGIESYDPVPADLRARMDALADARRMLRGQAPDSSENYAPLFATAARRFLDAWHRKRSKAGQSVDAARQYEPALRLFAEYIGPKPLKDIDREDVERYAAILAGFDKDWGRSVRTRGLGFWDLKARYGASDTPISGQAVRRHLQTLAMMWDWADREGLVARYNPFASVAGLYGGRALPALPWTHDELLRLFQPPPPPDLHEIMLLALMGGLKAREIAQLRACDLVTREGIDCLAIRSGRHPRRLPLPPALDWLAQRMRENPDDRPIWPRLQEDGSGKSLVKAFGDFKRQRGFSSRQKCFQSFRRTIRQQFEKKSVPEDIWFALMGRGPAHGTYRPASPPVRALRDTLASLDLPDLAKTPPAKMPDQGVDE
ncbi:MAG: hypothetical protein Kow00104_18520 [Rhodothalassiaceae bacterium]